MYSGCFTSTWAYVIAIMAFCIKLTWWDSMSLRGLKDASVRPMPLLIEQYSFLTFQLKSVLSVSPVERSWIQSDEIFLLALIPRRPTTTKIFHVRPKYSWQGLKVPVTSQHISETWRLIFSGVCVCVGVIYDLNKVCVWEFDTSVSFFCGFFCWIFLSHCSVRPGCIWDIDEKGWGQNVAFSYLKALSVSLGFQSVLSADRKMGVWNLLCRLYWIGTGRSLFFSRCLAQGRGASTVRTSPCISYLKWKKPIDVDLIGPSVIEGLFHALLLSHSHWSQWTLKCDINM